MKNILLATFALAGFALGQSSPPPTITLEIPIEAAGHSFQLFDNYPNPSLLYAGQPVYDAGLGKFLIVGAPPYGYTVPFLSDDSLGLSWEYSGFYITESVTWQPSLFGGGTIGYAVGEGLVGHTFALVAPSQNWAFPVTKLPVLGSWVLDSDGVQQWASFGFFNALSATEIASLSAANTVLVDLTAQMQSVANATDLRDPAAWAARTVALPTRAAVFSFGTVDYLYNVPAGTAYTLHTSSGSLQGVVPFYESLYDEGGGWSGYDLRVSGQVGITEEYWLTRDGTAETTPHFFMGVGSAEVVQSAVPLAVPTTNFQTVTFSIGENHFNESLVVSQSGNTISLNRSWTTNALVTWDQSGNEVTYAYDYYTATIDTNASWSLLDTSTSHDYGQTTQLLGGFTPWNPVPPAGSVTVAVSHSRLSALNAGQLKLRDVGQNTEWVVSLSDPVGNSYWMGFNLGTAEEFWTSVCYHTSYAPSASLSATDAVELVDYSNGDVRSFAFGSLGFDPAAWVPEVDTIITLPAQRWMSNLQVRTALGSVFSIERSAIQGLWSGGYFTSYGVFTATTKIHAGLPWWIHDLETNESLSGDSYLGDFTSWVGAADTADSDSDGLPAWYEYILGTSDNSTDSDGDGISDYAEVAAGTNPNQAAPILTVTSPVGAVWVN